MPTALLSVHDKAGLGEFAKGLLQRGFTLLASGGTAKALQAASLAVEEVADYTRSPEILGGRVKTLHPAVHGGILSREGAQDAEDLLRIGARQIDLVAVTLYPFVETIRRGVSKAEAIEEIDIGGVALLRAAAKNHDRVWVVPDPKFYGDVLAGIDGDDAQMRSRLAAEAFAHTAHYDMAIANYLAAAEWPPFPMAEARLAQTLRYGENPHQSGALYRDGTPGVAGGEQVQGKELSYNNLLDADAAWRLCLDLRPGGACVIKHQTPSGAAERSSLLESLHLAVAADDEAAFGGVVALRGAIDAEIAQYLVSRFFEVVVAEEIEPAAREILAQKPNLRVLSVPGLPREGIELRAVGGGFAAQTPDLGSPPPSEWRLAAGPARENLLADLGLAYRVVKHARSNAIVLVRDGLTVGIGSGQVSRIRAAGQALQMAGDAAKGAVLASDAFFPFGDVVQLAAKAGIAAIAEPGGSMRDQESFDAAQEHGVALYVTGVRHFRH